MLTTLSSSRGGAHREQETRIALFWWMLLGVPLAWQKAIRGSKVEWIGAEITASTEHLTVSIPPRKIDELTETIHIMLSKNVVAKTDILKLAGRLSYLAGLIIYLRAFIAPLWAVSADKWTHREDDCNSKTPRHLVHVKRIKPTLIWLRAFLTGEAQTIRRNYHFKAQSQVYLHIAMDASTTGLGGVLFDSQTGKPTQYFADPITEDDEKMLNTQRGQAKGMPIWEALAMLVALRTWSLPGETLCISVTGDCLGVLHALTKQASTNPMVNRVIQEVALDLASERYTIGSVTHVMSASNRLPDHLSRMFETRAMELPSELTNVPRRRVACRDSAFWHTAESRDSREEEKWGMMRADIAHSRPVACSRFTLVCVMLVVRVACVPYVVILSIIIQPLLCYASLSLVGLCNVSRDSRDVIQDWDAHSDSFIQRQHGAQERSLVERGGILFIQTNTRTSLEASLPCDSVEELFVFGLHTTHSQEATQT